ncbi:hypothetical protein A1O1_01308 [Capronia coronata CBS 617.96]|uniref:Uncharacterized protein n=1 Tax=Capronia coronata CBS 617.96 TaxID=1182541 RepID=W9YTF2_9EURO|nr:uncharacterized protein A1O1_01308 [Capronia coronata CBS 617.96]EXJ96182.1 hypothetical protein A1O1_01308 [Capronia coronata CBS 617.96]
MSKFLIASLTEWQRFLQCPPDLELKSPTKKKTTQTFQERALKTTSLTRCSLLAPDPLWKWINQYGELELLPARSPWLYHVPRFTAGGDEDISNRRHCSVSTRLSGDALKKLPQAKAMTEFLNTERLEDRLLKGTAPVQNEGQREGKDAVERLDMWMSLITPRSRIDPILDPWATRPM